MRWWQVVVVVLIAFVAGYLVRGWGATPEAAQREVDAGVAALHAIDTAEAVRHTEDVHARQEIAQLDTAATVAEAEAARLETAAPLDVDTLLAANTKLREANASLRKTLAIAMFRWHAADSAAGVARDSLASVTRRLAKVAKMARRCGLGGTVGYAVAVGGHGVGGSVGFTCRL